MAHPEIGEGDQQDDADRRDQRRFRPAISAPGQQAPGREQDVHPHDLLEEIEREGHAAGRLEHAQRGGAGAALHQQVDQREMAEPDRDARELAGDPQAPRARREAQRLRQPDRAGGEAEAVAGDQQPQIEARAPEPLDNAPFPQRDADQHRAERLEHVPEQPFVGEIAPIAPRILRIGQPAALMRGLLAGDAHGIGDMDGELAPFGERGGLAPLHLLHEFRPRGIFARAIFGDAEPGEHRPAQPQRDQRLRTQGAERKQEQRGERIDVQDVAGPEQHEHVEQAESEQPQVAPVIEVGDRHRPVGRHRLAGQHHHAGAEQEFEQAALRAREEQVHRHPCVAIRRRPADQPDVGREGPDARRHIGHVDVEDAEDRQPAQHVEHVDARLAAHGRQSGIARFHHHAAHP